MYLIVVIIDQGRDYGHHITDHSQRSAKLDCSMVSFPTEFPTANIIIIILNPKKRNRQINISCMNYISGFNCWTPLMIRICCQVLFRISSSKSKREKNIHCSSFNYYMDIEFLSTYYFLLNLMILLAPFSCNLHVKIVGILHLLSKFISKREKISYHLWTIIIVWLGMQLHCNGELDGSPGLSSILEFAPANIVNLHFLSKWLIYML